MSISFNQDHCREYIADVRRLVAIAAQHGETWSEEQAYLRWRQFSEDFACGWHVLYPNDGQNWAALRGAYRFDLDSLIDELEDAIKNRESPSTNE